MILYTSRDTLIQFQTCYFLDFQQETFLYFTYAVRNFAGTGYRSLEGIKFASAPDSYITLGNQLLSLYTLYRLLLNPHTLTLSASHSRSLPH